jgi:2-amino-4-hydroxy-6-hydroxymethyldihydropteridine diphosphokinase
MDTPAEPRVLRECGVSFGANLEEPLTALTKAADLLNRVQGLSFREASSVWLTEPVGGPPGQNWYHNQVLIYETSLTPPEIVPILLATEARLGRVRRERWGPRVIDLDLLYLGDLVTEEIDSWTPHPRLSERAFVLYPLAELRPDWIHPATGVSVAELIKRLPEKGPGFYRLET